MSANESMWNQVGRSLWRRPQARVCLLLVLLYLGVALAGYAGLLPSHDAPVGVKCMTKRGCLASQACTSGWLCVA